jgi:hypothetical protein
MEFGVKLDFKQESWPVSIAIDFLASSDDTTMSFYDPVYGSMQRLKGRHRSSVSESEKSGTTPQP